MDLTETSRCWWSHPCQTVSTTARLFLEVSHRDDKASSEKLKYTWLTPQSRNATAITTGEKRAMRQTPPNIRNFSSFSTILPLLPHSCWYPFCYSSLWLVLCSVSLTYSTVGCPKTLLTCGVIRSFIVLLFYCFLVWKLCQARKKQVSWDSQQHLKEVCTNVQYHPNNCTILYLAGSLVTPLVL